MRLPGWLRRPAAALPVWAYVAHFVDHPAGPAFRGRCGACPWDGPAHQVPAHRLDADTIAAAGADPPAGPNYEAARKAEGDLIGHLWHRHGLRVNRRPARSLRFHLGRPQ